MKRFIYSWSCQLQCPILSMWNTRWKERVRWVCCSQARTFSQAAAFESTLLQSERFTVSVFHSFHSFQKFQFTSELFGVLSKLAKDLYFHYFFAAVQASMASVLPWRFWRLLELQVGLWHQCLYVLARRDVQLDAPEDWTFSFGKIQSMLIFPVDSSWSIDWLELIGILQALIYDASWQPKTHLN